MQKERKLIIAGNWKMNKTVAEALDLVKGCKRELTNVKEVDIVVCPPFTALSEVSKAVLNSNIRLGAQNMSEHNYGAYTGEIAAGMLKEFSVRYVILGHSERRHGHGEDDAAVHQKILGAWRAGLTTILCVGETRAQREAGTAVDIIASQLARSMPSDAVPDSLVVAYEPVWAIGTGLTATLEDIAAVHAAIRTRLPAQTRILYGGSVNPQNALSILGLAEVDGALVGGASLDAESFWTIARSCPSPAQIAGG